MDTVDSFSGDGINHQADAVLCDNKFPSFGEMVQMLDDVAADGIVIFGFQMKIQFFVEVSQLGRTKYLIFIFLNPADGVFLIMVVLITDVSDDFLQQVLQSDHSHGGAIFIQYDGEIHRVFPHFYHEFRRFFCTHM